MESQLPGDGTWTRRSVPRLQRIAGLLTADLQRTLPGQWRADVDEYFVLFITDGHRQEGRLLAAEVIVDNWPDEAWEPEVREDTLDDDASEAIAMEISEVLDSWGQPWPLCPAHTESLEMCSMTWVCDGPPVHDVCALGELRPAGQSRQRR